MIPDDVLERAKEVVKKFPICDHCLGRAFLEVEGKNNKERGEKIREALGLSTVDPERCYFCGGVFNRLDELAKKAEKEMRGYYFQTFRVGTRIPKWMIAREEELWEIAGVKNTETIKKHLNREIGKILKAKTGKKYEPEEPDIEVIVDVESGEIHIIPRPIYLYGRYRKMSKIPQGKWPCPYCGGGGCEKCEYTGRKWKETVEYIMADVVLGVTGGTDTKLHAGGREEPDVLVLGNGRPFVLEIVQPRRRLESWNWVKSEINAHGAGKIEILCLKEANKRAVREIKEEKYTITYEVIAHCDKNVNIEQLSELKEKIVFQRTPSRMLERKKEGLRKKKILYITGERIADSKIKLYITVEQGLHIREFITGDNGRTKPSVSEILGLNCIPEEIKIVRIEGGEEC